ncbi:sensor histidine kinase [Nafulsella turpanensis]|uniref:sensor histidine kinase n=1 Tax=Nafulsella turpanensis TaxID=1265690 RepID=UPI00034BEF1C|nr:sensor histidine kinase [Nafulsella turpanensis]
MCKTICRKSGRLNVYQKRMLLFLWILSGAAGASANPFTGQNLLFFTDTARVFTLQEVQSLPPSALTQVYTPTDKGVLWVQWSVLNTANKAEEAVLSVGEVPFLSLFLQQGSSLTEMRSGLFVPYGSRSSPHHKSLFRFVLEPNEKTVVWVRMDTDNRHPLPATFKAELKSVEVLQQENERRLLVQGLFFGIIMVMAFYNLMLFLAVRDISYLYYVLSIVGIGLYFFFYYGFSLQTIWQNQPVWNAYSFSLIVPVTNIMRIMFTKTYLSTKDMIPWLNRFLNLLLVLCFVPIAMGLLAFFFELSWYELTIDVTGVMGTAVLSSMLLAGILTYLRGYTPALFFIVANLLFVLGANMFIIKEMHLLTESIMSRYAVQLGVIAQVILFSLGLAYRLKKARQEALNQTLERERLEREKETERKELVEQQKKELEEKVAARTAALQEKTLELQATIHKLRQSEDGLRQLNKIKDKLFSVISHDLRGPVATLDSFISIITQHATRISEEEMSKLSGKTRESVNNLSFLLDNLLNWSRTQMGTLSFRPEPLDLKAIVQKNTELYSFNAEAKKLSLVTDVPEEVVAHGDHGMIDFIIRNLLSNAIKFTPAYGTIKVIVRAENNGLWFSISDTGIGMSAEHLKRVADPEDTFSTPGTAREKGTGLGLCLCQEFLALHGTQLEISSEKDIGSQFSFRLLSKQPFAPYNTPEVTVV